MADIDNRAMQAHGDKLANYLTMLSGIGVAICVSGVAEPFLGMAGDAVGLAPVILILAAVAALGAVLGLIIQMKGKGRVYVPDAPVQNGAEAFDVGFRPCKRCFKELWKDGDWSR